MGWDHHRHELIVETDAHGGEHQARAEELHRDLIDLLRLEAAAFLAWRDPTGELIRWVALDGPGRGTESWVRWRPPS